MKPWMWIVLSLIGAGLFIWPGVIKLLDPVAFMTDLQTYHLFPYKMALFAVYFIPALEIIAGLGLLYRKTYAGAWLIQLTLMLAFITVISISYFRGIDISCGCFKSGGGEPSSYAWLFVRDFLILGYIVILSFNPALRFHKKNHHELSH